MATSLQFSRLVRPSVFTASRLAAQRRFGLSFLLAVAVVLVGTPWQQGNTPLQALSADGVGEPGTQSEDPVDLPPPPSGGGTPPGASKPLQIYGLTAANVFDDMWIIEGQVIGSIPVQGLTVVFGGLAAGKLTLVTSDDTFLITMSIPRGTPGDVSAVVQGPDGVNSPMAIVPIDGGVSIGGA